MSVGTVHWDDSLPSAGQLSASGSHGVLPIEDRRDVWVCRRKQPAAPLLSPRARGVRTGEWHLARKL